MYWYYTEPSAGTVYDCFPKAVLTVAEELGVPIILHVPRIITQCKDELIALCEEFPRLKVCVPHLGSTKFVIDGLAETYRALATSTSIVMDTSLNPNADIIRMALEAFGHERILFGSDQPLNLVRYVPFINPERGQRIVTQFKYHWVDKSEHLQFADLAAGEITHCHWLAINALRQVIDERADADVVKRAIFHDNARLFYGFTL
jgi:predicted TIM-barrel fold metal-dependent hydrolase